ncbi:unnamed protein product [Brassicogethes aeneus]|uniref:Dopa decarboxylase n=1 Tax=Brassicogethes aeneus TaxID=1431903 RepID=A0A9P0BAI9_BRAAE|nr:unnamed protein product [Brassicogethes aeneus]
MNTSEFREFGKSAVDYIADYLDNIRDKKVISSKKPGFLQNKLTKSTPINGDPWQDVMRDVDQLIVPGLSHWQSPNFHAFFPTSNSYPGIVGELMCAGLGAVAKDWISNPACVELEVKMMDWLAKLLDLPKEFLNSSEGPGGGVIQNAASESTLVAVLSGMARSVKNEQILNPHRSEAEIKSKLVTYTSLHSNCSVEKAGLLASAPMRLLATDKHNRLRGHTLEEAIRKDREQGFIPCCVVATLGTTGTCSFDNLEEIGLICRRENIFLHVDAAYAGAAFVCPEYRHYMKGVDYVDTFSFNPHKWMLVNSDCSAMWFRDTSEFSEAYRVQKSMPETEIQPHKEVYGIDIENWQIPNIRRFRALKLWFVLRTYGVQGLRKHIRDQCSLAEYFTELLKVDDRFEVLNSVMGLVCFRVMGDDSVTRKLLEKISERRNLFLTPYTHEDRMLIRFVICSPFTQKEDIKYAWNEIVSTLNLILDVERIKG